MVVNFKSSSCFSFFFFAAGDLSRMLGGESSRFLFFGFGVAFSDLFGDATDFLDSQPNI